MESLPSSLRRAVRVSRAATLAESACLAMGAAATASLAALGDGHSPLSSTALSAAGVAFAAVLVASLRLRWEPEGAAIRRADRVSQAQDRLATQYALLGRGQPLSGLEALCVEEGKRWTAQSPGVSFRSFFQPVVLLAPLFAGSLLGLFAWMPGSAWSGGESMATIRESLRRVAREAAREGAREGEALAQTLERIREALGDSQGSAEALARMRDLHEQILRQPSSVEPGPSASVGAGISAQTAQQALSVLEKAMIAASARVIPEGSAGPQASPSSRAPQRDGASAMAIPGSETPAVQPGGERVEARVSSAYAVPPRFEPVVRRYFALRDEAPR